MKSRVIINDKHKLYDQNEVQDLLNKTLALMHADEELEIELNVIDNQKIRKLNKKYRNKDVPTDVLSFAFRERKGKKTPKFVQPRQKKIKLGQIFVSYDKVVEQSRAHSQSIVEEAQFLFIHGLLHLLGLDHKDDLQEHEMRQFEKQILN